MTSVEYEQKRQRDERKLMIRKACLVGVVIIVLIIVITFVFTKFKLYSEARIALREAKNIKMSLETADLEYYSIGLSIYDETAEGNIRKGATEYVSRLQDDIKGYIRLTGYDSTKGAITGFEYELENYIVRYSHSEDGNEWQVFQIKEILDY